MSPLAVENGSLVTSGGSLCETCCSPLPEWGVCCLPPDHPTLPNSCEAVANKAECDAFGGTFYQGAGCNDPGIPCGSGACCYHNGIEWRCTDGYQRETCDARGGTFYQGQACGEISCGSTWGVDCFDDGTVPGADCSSCGAGPFNTYDEANAWVIANPPPPGCEQTIVEIPARRNPLP